MALPLNSLDNCGEVVIGEDHVRGLLGDFSASDTHGDTNMGLLESWCIIDTITSHCNDFTL